MEQLKNYITLLRVAKQTLEKLHNSNHVAYFDRDNSIIFLDGDKLNDFCTSHTIKEMFELLNDVIYKQEEQEKFNN